MISPEKDTSSLLFRCPQSAAVASRLTEFFTAKKALIQKSTQYTQDQQCFFRVEWEVGTGWKDEAKCLNDLELEFGKSSDEQSYSVRLAGKVASVGFICSEHTHIVSDVLHRIGSEYYPAISVQFIISDNESVRSVADRYRVPFFYIPSSESAKEVQRRQLEIIERYTPQFLGLAGYESRLSAQVIKRVSTDIFSVHNSLFPAVKSAKAYSMALQQGVKLIGATAQMVQGKELGPIVEQDVARFWPGISSGEVQIMGRGVERKVFAAALRKLVEHKVMVYNAKTIVFD